MGTHTEPAVPLLIQSSGSLGWGNDLEIRTYWEPDTIEGWRDPVIPEVSLVFLTRGTMAMQYQRARQLKRLHIREGDLFLKPSGAAATEVAWQCLSQEPMQTVHVLLSQALFSQNIAAVADRDPSRTELARRSGVHDPLLLQMALALQREMENPSPLSKMYAESASHMLAVHLLKHYVVDEIHITPREPRLAPRQLERITEYIHAHLADDLSLDALSSLVGFSVYHFTRVFRQATGESAHQFVMRHRLEHARRLLTSTSLPIAEIALCSGFTHQSHLTQAFRRHIGLTPHAYRRSYTL